MYVCVLCVCVCTYLYMYLLCIYVYEVTYFVFQITILQLFPILKQADSNRRKLTLTVSA